MTISEKLNAAIKEKQISLRELSEKAKVPKSAIQRYTSGDTEKIPIDRLEAIAYALGINPAFFMGWEDDPEPPRALPANLRPLSELHHQRVPLIGSVAAGQPIMAEQDFDTFVDAPVKCDAALTVEGDSMAPGFQSGDIVYIRCQPDVRDGQIAVVLIDDSATLKHVYHDRDGLTLISDNPAYAPIRVNGTEHDYIAIYGIVVGFTRMFKSSNPMSKVKKGFK